MSLLVFSLGKERVPRKKNNYTVIFLFLLSWHHVIESDLSAIFERESQRSHNFVFVYIIAGMAFLDCSELNMIQTR